MLLRAAAAPVRLACVRECRRGLLQGSIVPIAFGSWYPEQLERSEREAARDEWEAARTGRPLAEVTAAREQRRKDRIAALRDAALARGDREGAVRAHFLGRERVSEEAQEKFDALMNLRAKKLFPVKGAVGADAAWGPPTKGQPRDVARAVSGRRTKLRRRVHVKRTARRKVQAQLVESVKANQKMEALLDVLRVEENERRLAKKERLLWYPQQEKDAVLMRHVYGTKDAHVMRDAQDAKREVKLELLRDCQNEVLGESALDDEPTCKVDLHSRPLTQQEAMERIMEAMKTQEHRDMEAAARAAGGEHPWAAGDEPDEEEQDGDHAFDLDAHDEDEHVMAEAMTDAAAAAAPGNSDRAARLAESESADVRDG